MEKLYPGSSVANPIDFLATGNAKQLGDIIDYCDQKFDQIDAMVVIFGTPGLSEIYDVYDVLDEKIKTSKKPIYPVLPSIKTAHKEVLHFLSKGRINFSDEVVLGDTLSKVFNTPKPAKENVELPDIDTEKIRTVIDNCQNGYLMPEDMQQLLDAAGIGRTSERVVENKEAAIKYAKEVGFPLVMKVVGPLHKSDVGGVVLNINNLETVENEFNRLIKIPETTAIQIYPMLFGTEVFIGSKKEQGFGHLVLCGIGGIFIEVFKDVNSGIAPLSETETRHMIETLKGYKIIEGTRNQEPVNIDLFIDAVRRVSALVTIAPEIEEMDLNPLLGTKESLTAVDVRINIQKSIK